jgi:hypothetical protein
MHRAELDQILLKSVDFMLHGYSAATSSRDDAEKYATVSDSSMKSVLIKINLTNSQDQFFVLSPPGN